MKTFADISINYGKLNNSKIVLITVPYDYTSTWIKGASRGPSAFLEASKNMELYDIETNSEVYKNGIFLKELFHIKNKSKDLVNNIYNITKKYLLKKKYITIVGGNHSISIGSIKAFSKMFSNLNIIQLDAHTDLRPSYKNDPYNHACSMYEISKNHKLIQVGIRSMSIKEKKYIKNKYIFYASEIYKNNNWIKKIIEIVSSPIYITIDLDVFDPSIAPSVGTPEPGGLFWYETITFLSSIFKKKNVVGFDIVELSPNNNEKSTAFLAAKLYYKLLSYKFKISE